MVFFDMQLGYFAMILETQIGSVYHSECGCNFSYLSNVLISLSCLKTTWKVIIQRSVALS